MDGGVYKGLGMWDLGALFSEPFEEEGLDDFVSFDEPHYPQLVLPIDFAAAARECPEELYCATRIILYRRVNGVGD